MRHPPYNLRPNKAVDRLVLIEAISRLERLGEELSDYTYHGLGGPYLEDFRLMYEFYPEIKLVSIEEDKETLKRQEFHLPCGTLQLKKDKVESFLLQYEPEDAKSIFWLDYTRLEYRNFEDFEVLLGKVADNSMVKVTLPAEPCESREDPEEFIRRFGAVMPDPSSYPPHRNGEFAHLLQRMLQVAAQKAPLSVMNLTFQPVSSFFYSDGTSMFTLTGIVCERGKETRIKEAFGDWPFANLNWKKPEEIAVPMLSTHERLHLQANLPCGGNAGRELRRALGYNIEKSWRRTEEKMSHYAKFHRYYPYFMKIIP